MKHKKLILMLSIFIISFAYIIHPYIQEKKQSVDTFKEQIIRFHIKANSDELEDQALKLKIRDEILREVGGNFKHSTSIDETRHIIENNMDTIKAIAEKEIEKEGKDYEVDVYLGKDHFPTRHYGNIVFPSGEYEALKLTIGEGKGKNWWCVMFPPLCFVDITHGVSNDLDEELQEVLSEEDYNQLRSNKEVEVEKKEEPEIKLKSKIAEVFERTRSYFARLSLD